MKKQAMFLSFAVASSLYGSVNLDWSREYPIDNTDINNSVTSSTIVNDGIMSVGTTTGNSLFPTENPPSTPDQNVFVMKHSFDGNLSWYITFGAGLFPDEAVKVLSSPTGGIFVVGSTSGKINQNTVNLGNTDMFLTKLENNGSIVWTKQFGTAGRDYAKDATVDKLGNIYISGLTDGNLSDENNSNIVPSDRYSNKYSSFILKFDQNGNRVREHIYPVTTYKEFKLSLKTDEVNSTKIIAVHPDTLTAYPVIKVYEANLSVVSDINLGSIFNFPIIDNFDFISKDGNLTLFILSNKVVKKLDLNLTSNTISLMLNSYGDAIGNQVYNFGLDPLSNSLYVYKKSMNKFDLTKLDASTFAIKSDNPFGGQVTGATNYDQEVSTIQIINNQIFATGNFYNYTLSNSQLLGTGPFVARLSDSYSNLSIKEGWNLISANIPLSVIPQNAIIVYQYTPANQTYCDIYPGDTFYCKNSWKFYSPVEKIRNSMNSYNNIPEITTSLENRYGTWIYSDANITIKGDENNDSLRTNNYPQGWSLNGVGVDSNALTFGCQSSSIVAEENLTDGNKSIPIFDGNVTVGSFTIFENSDLNISAHAEIRIQKPTTVIDYSNINPAEYNLTLSDTGKTIGELLFSSKYLGRSFTLEINNKIYNETLATGSMGVVASNGISTINKPTFVKATWKLDSNGNWNINTQDQSFLPSVPRLPNNIMPKNSGFWVNCVQPQ